MAGENALAMNAMLYEVVQSGTGRGAAVPGREVAGKTGTSADYRDAWFLGFAPQLVTGVWVGNDDFTPTKRVTGGSLPAQIWSGFMRTALKDMPATTLPRAEPLSVPPPVAGNYDDEGPGFFNRVGSFFERLFGGRPAPPPPRRQRGWPRNSDNSYDIPDAEQQQLAQAGQVNQDSYSTGRQSNGTAGQRADSSIDANRYGAQPPQFDTREQQSENGTAANSSEQPYRSQTQRDDPYDQQRYAYRSQDPRYGDWQRDRDYYSREPQTRYEYGPSSGYYYESVP